MRRPTKAPGAGKTEGPGPALREGDIRPPELIAGQQAALLADVARLQSRSGEFVSVPCPACGADHRIPKFVKRGFYYDECRECRTVFMNPRPSPSVLEWFYRESANYRYWNQHIFPASESARRNRIAVPRADTVQALCQKHGVATAALLEVGAGFGTFCSEMQERRAFQRIVAIEPTPELAESCRAKGLETIESPMERVRFQDRDRFDVAASFEVLEHLFSPRDFLRLIRESLRPGGMAVITCPNGQGFDIQTLGVLSTTVDHEHLNYFNPGSLSGLMEDCGFTVLECVTPGRLDAELVRNRVLAGEFDLTGQPFLQRALIDEWGKLGPVFQDFLAANRLSSNMWIAARRRASG